MKTLINSLNISFLEKYTGSENNPATILFIHGNSLSKDYFTKQLNSNLNKSFRLIALDLPGHGNSDKCEKYSFPLLVKTVHEFIRKEVSSSLFIVGHSLGGHLASSLLNKVDCLGIFIFGAPPISSPTDFSKAAHPNEAAAGFFKGELEKKERELMERCLFAENYKADFSLPETISCTDPNARIGIANSVINNEMCNEIEILDQNKDCFKILICFKDVLINAEYILKLAQEKNWQNNLYFIENSGHTPQLEQADLFNNLLFNFVKSRFIDANNSAQIH